MIKRSIVGAVGIFGIVAGAMYMDYQNAQSNAEAHPVSECDNVSRTAENVLHGIRVEFELCENGVLKAKADDHFMSYLRFDPTTGNYLAGTNGQIHGGIRCAHSPAAGKSSSCAVLTSNSVEAIRLASETFDL